MYQVSVLPFIFKKTSQCFTFCCRNKSRRLSECSNYKMRENPALCSTEIIKNPKPSNKYDVCTFMHQLPCKKPCDEYQHTYRKKGKALYKLHQCEELVSAEK